MTEIINLPKSPKFRVWHMPQLPGPTFYVYVDTLKEARVVEDTLAFYDLFQFENKIKPDYSNFAGIERFDAEGDPGDEEGLQWEEVDPEETE